MVQYTTVDRDTGQYKALVGNPVGTDIQGPELYLVMPLDNEESTMALMHARCSPAVWSSWCCSW